MIEPLQGKCHVRAHGELVDLQYGAGAVDVAADSGFLPVKGNVPP